MNSSDLLQRARQGDAAAFQQLIRPHVDSVRRFARSFARNWNDADDIAQESLIKAFRSMNSYREEASLSTWLYRITRNTGIDWYRSKLGKAATREGGELESVSHEANEGSDVNQEKLLWERERAEALWKGIHDLDPSYRVALVLAEIEGKSYEEIARIEGIPLGTVRSRLNRAKKRLAARLRDDDAFARNTPLPPSPVPPPGEVPIEADSAGTFAETSASNDAEEQA